MTIASVAFVPSAPLLIPAVAGGSAALDDDLRAASLAAVGRLVAAEPTEVVVAAATTTPGSWTADASWDFAGFGVPRGVDSGGPVLPWSLGIGAWLLDECGWAGPRTYVGVASGVNAATSGPGTAVLAVGDGTGCRTEKAPGHLDPRAEGFDAVIADCLARGDAAGLAAIDPDLARELLCGGAPVWRWLASAIGEQPVTAAELTANEAPYGVAYFVTSWTLA